MKTVLISTPQYLQYSIVLKSKYIRVPQRLLDRLPHQLFRMLLKLSEGSALLTTYEDGDLKELTAKGLIVPVSNKLSIQGTLLIEKMLKENVTYLLDTCIEGDCENTLCSVLCRLGKEHFPSYLSHEKDWVREIAKKVYEEL